jgi:hypothetical protein
VSCTFVLSTQPPDSNNVYVYLDKLLVQKDPVNGWAFGANVQTIVLSGLACDKVTSGQAGTVQALFGCPGGPPPPALLP